MVVDLHISLILYKIGLINSQKYNIYPLVKICKLTREGKGKVEGRKENTKTKIIYATFKGKKMIFIVGST